MSAVSNLASVDLNLLVALDALLIECNVTRAAERTSVGQSTMSASLARLRKHFDDELLVRDGRRLVLTPFAESLAEPVREAISSVEAVLLGRTIFDPASEARSFTVVASDYVTLILLRPLLAQLVSDAPHVRLNIVPVMPDFMDQLRRAQIDILIMPSAIVGEQALPHTRLFSEEFVLACARENSAVGNHVSAAEFAELPYVSYRSGPLAGLAEKGLLEAGITPRTEVRTENIVMTPFLLSETGLVSLIHKRLGRLLSDYADLRLLEPPIPLSPVVEFMYWNPARTADPAHQWLRSRIVETARQLD